MLRNQNSIKGILNVIKHNRSFVLLGHARPDGDTIGSELALMHYLTRLNKNVEIINREKVPKNLLFLPGADRIKQVTHTSSRYDVAILLECPSSKRFGNIIELNEDFTTIVNIDHHSTSMRDYSGKYNLIDPKASSCAELVYTLLKGNIDKTIALCLYVGLVTDTNKFQHKNTSSRVFRIASFLVKMGVDPAYVYKQLYATKTPEYIHLLGLILLTFKTTLSGQIGYMELTKKLCLKAKSQIEHTDDIITYGSIIPSIKVFILFREIGDKLIKVSLRSYDNIDVNYVAEHFGGGGHKNAAGCELKGELKAVKRKIISYLQKYIF